MSLTILLGKFYLYFTISTILLITMSIPPESVFPGFRGMPPESVFPERFFHHPDHRSYWQRLDIKERVMVIISSVLGVLYLQHSSIGWSIHGSSNCGSGVIQRRHTRSHLYLPWSSCSRHRFDTGNYVCFLLFYSKTVVEQKHNLIHIF
jgi:hypothetical protein